MMDFKTIREELHKLSALVDGWENSEGVSTLERDLALEKLRTLYEAVRFAAERSAAESPVREEPASPVDIDLGAVLSLEPLPDTQSDFGAGTVLPAAEIDTGPQTAAAEPVPAEVFVEPQIPEEEPVPAEPCAESETPGIAVPEEPAPEPEIFLSPEPESDFAASSPVPAPAPKVPEVLEPKPESDPESVFASEPAAAPEVKPQYIAPTLFGLEEETVRHRHKQRVIMSLYDTAPADAPARPEPSVRPESARPEPLSNSGPSVKSADEPALTGAGSAAGESSAADSESAAPLTEPERVAVSAPEIPASERHTAAGEPVTEEESVSVIPEPIGEKKPENLAGPTALPGQDDDESVLEEITLTPAPGAVLGEVMNHDVQTLADTIAPPRDVASQLRRSEPVTDLRKAIGINDKFLLIRDLFGGDGAAYDEAIATLNGFDDLDDCMIYIAENYAWNPNSDGAKMLMELLERKFA